MVRLPSKKAKGIRSKTRHSFRKKGSKTTVNKLLMEIPDGTKVDIKVDSSVHSAMPPARYIGRTGTVTSKQGSAYLVDVKNGNKMNSLILSPAHLTISRGSKQPEAKKGEAAAKLKEPKKEAAPKEAEAAA